MKSIRSILTIVLLIALIVVIGVLLIPPIIDNLNDDNTQEDSIIGIQGEDPAIAASAEFYEDIPLGQDPNQGNRNLDTVKLSLDLDTIIYESEMIIVTAQYDEQGVPIVVESGELLPRDPEATQGTSLEIFDWRIDAYVLTGNQCEEFLFLNNPPVINQTVVLGVESVLEQDCTVNSSQGILYVKETSTGVNGPSNLNFRFDPQGR